MSTVTHARACYEAGERAFACGFYLDAQAAFDRACRLEPENSLYRTARERLRILAFRFGKKLPSVKGSDIRSACAEGCCECCGEGCCELLCEGICGGCDCS